MSKTGNPAEIARLNHLLGTELGFKRVRCPHLLLALESPSFCPERILGVLQFRQSRLTTMLARANLPRYSQDLPFANHLLRFNPLNHFPGRRRGARPFDRPQSPLDVAVVGLDRFIAVAPRALPATAAPFNFPRGADHASTKLAEL